MSRVRVSLAAPNFYGFMASCQSAMINEMIKSRYQPTIKILPLSYWYKPKRYNARVVELVDTRDLKSLAEKRAGSSPAPGTIYLKES